MIIRGCAAELRTVTIQGVAIAEAGELIPGAYVPAHIMIITNLTTIVTLVSVFTHPFIRLLLAILSAHPMTGF